MTRDAGRRRSGRPDGALESPAKRPARSSGGQRRGLPKGRRPVDIAGSIGKIAVVLVVVGGVGIVAYNMFLGGARVGGPVAEPATLSTLASTGKVLFKANCAGCHGPKADGTDQGPPFVNDIYNPGHHPDAAFLSAAKNGVRAHHWRFGNMPPVEGITEAEIVAIVKYVRELQEANGIAFRPHVM